MHRSAARFLTLARYLFSPLIGSKSEINGMAHFTFARPFRELHFCDQLRFDPGGYSFVLHSSDKRRLRGFNLRELAVQISKHLVTKASPDMPDVSPTVFLPHCQDQRPKKRPPPLGSREPRYHHFLTFRCLDFQPVFGAGA